MSLGIPAVTRGNITVKHIYSKTPNLYICTPNLQYRIGNALVYLSMYVFTQTKRSWFKIVKNKINAELFNKY